MLKYYSIWSKWKEKSETVVDEASTRLMSDDRVCRVNCSELNALENYYTQYFHQHNTIIKK